jgi:hypothetical protein
MTRQDILYKIDYAVFSLTEWCGHERDTDKLKIIAEALNSCRALRELYAGPYGMMRGTEDTTEEAKRG